MNDGYKQLKALCSKWNLSIYSCLPIDKRHDGISWDDKNATHWLITIVRPEDKPGKKFSYLTCEYSMGSTHKGKPRLEDVLYSLAIDASDEDFEEWCHSFGYEPDSISAHKIWEKCRDIVKDFKRLDIYEQELEEIRGCEL
jgi:hypothetical protein